MRKLHTLITEAYINKHKIPPDEANDLAQTAVDLMPSNRPKLSKNDVKAIKSLADLGYNDTFIAKTFSVHRTTIARTLQGIYH